MSISDLQSAAAERALPIQRVGVRGLRLPGAVADGDVRFAAGAVEWRAYTDLPASARGTHMSRLVQALHEKGGELSAATFAAVAADIQKRLGAAQVRLAAHCRCFLQKSAPASGAAGMIDARLSLFCARNGEDETLLARLSLPVTTLCPCSKSISKYGAHNQRSMFSITYEPQGGRLEVEKMAALAESCASAGLYSVLKRPDEKFVTEQAYDNPKFVEDAVRDMAAALSARGGDFCAEAENFESIHNHAAYAAVESPNFPRALLAGLADE